MTEDDLKTAPRISPEIKEEDEDFNPVCNPDCEEMVRAEIQVQPEHELEFRNRFQVATQETGRDTKWNNLLYEATNTASSYCEYKRKDMRPSEYLPILVIQKQKDLWYKFKEAEGWMKVRLQDVGRIDPFRATIMQSQWQVGARRVCEGVSLQ